MIEKVNSYLSTGQDDKKKFSCERCNTVYQHKRTLQRHQRFECGQPPQFNCPYCGLPSKRKCNINMHLKRCQLKPTVEIDEEELLLSMSMIE